MNEISYQVLPRSSVDASIFGTTVPPQTLTTATIPAPPPVFRDEPQGAPLEAVIQALYALHKVNACLNDNIQVTRNAGGPIIVRGVVDTAQRKERIEAILSSIQGVQVQLRTLEESQAGSAAATSAKTTEVAGKVALAESHAAPIQELLKGKLSASGITQLSYRAVSLSEDWVAEAWALRRLAESIPAQDLGDLTKSSSAMLAEMVRDHTTSLQAKIAQCRTEFEPYLSGGAVNLGGETGEMAWPASAQQVFMAATRAADQTRLMCASSGAPPVPASDEIRNLVATLSNAQSHTARLETSIARALESRAQSAQTTGTKNK